MMAGKLSRLANKMGSINYAKPAHTKLATKLKFYAVRLLQKSLGKKDPEHTDYKYWAANGWTKSVRPWKEN